MEFKQNYTPLEAEKIHEIASEMHEAGNRYVQILAINYDDCIDLVYTFMTTEGELKDYNVDGLAKDAAVDSITDLFFEAFVCENEIHDLFGITFNDLKLDFAGQFYALSEDKPMTVISAEELARREKEAKIAAAKAAKIAKAKAEAAAKKAAAAEAKTQDSEAPAAEEKPADASAPAEENDKTDNKSEGEEE
ncbi:MAG: NADH-quinone oxidoreductase subunit C [Phoenicibacter congonensis]|uniref:NADH-quinone oxidoreductase subunit C n=1 Tax=Phoenicibacter congonensis TaxID=1944646 RepID=A0AA43RGX4_9ACTN|nr:NADH-quinone oxidoreductase subunit C [Phoenicibacter congonensis]